MRGVFLFAFWPAFLSAVRSTDTATSDESPSDSQSPAALFFSRTTIPNSDVTYVERHFLTSESEQWMRPAWASRTHHKPDTTVVLLNWSRLQNVILQASVYCVPQLQDIVERVFIWNNRPDVELDYEEHFSGTGCSPERLEIFNSPSNIYFQDDDYITRPEIFRNIHATFSRAASTTSSPSAIILLPSHDHLETDLLDVSIPYSTSEIGFINTTFACLGHGTFLLRSQAAKFLALLRQLGLSDEEMNIADNYFTLLGARWPETWLTHTIELNDAGVVPFTVGVEGSKRNWKHIDRAMVYLMNTLSLTSGVAASDETRRYSSISKSSQAGTHNAPCILDACIISSNILMVPPCYATARIWARGIKMQDIQAMRLARFGPDGARWYINHPLSNAVDGDVETSFRSIGYANEGDMISLTLTQTDSKPNGLHPDGTVHLDVVWLVDAGTASILHATDLEISRDGNLWRTLTDSPLTCLPASSLPLPRDFRLYPPFMLRSFDTSIVAAIQSTNKSSTVAESTVPDASLLECHTSFRVEDELPKHIRVRLGRDKQVEWVIYEMWVRSRVIAYSGGTRVQ